MTGMPGFPASDTAMIPSAGLASTSRTALPHAPDLVFLESGWVGILVGARSKCREDDMTGVESRNFESPDETRTPDKTTVELVNVAGGQIGRRCVPDRARTRCLGRGRRAGCLRRIPRRRPLRGELDAARAMKHGKGPDRTRPCWVRADSSSCPPTRPRERNSTRSSWPMR
jgi:hypothetical protein